MFLVMVMLPLARRDSEGQGMVVLRAAAQRFLAVAWGAMVLLAITGVYLGWDHWNIGPGVFFSNGGHFLRTLQIKTRAVSFCSRSQPGPRFLAGSKIVGPVGCGPGIRGALTGGL